MAREPMLARVMSDALVMAWVTGAASHAPPPPEGPPPALPMIPPDESGVRLPAVEAAAAGLASRRVLTEFRFRELEQDARRGAFTVSRVATEDALEKIQAALVIDVREGGTLRDFRRRVDEALGASMLAPAHVETLYRTNTARAMTAGLMEVLAHPLVEDEFPYLQYESIHDARARPEHRAMETLGLDGGNIYRRDDPVWRLFLPPWGFSCRCAIIPLSVEDAAAAGVKEARAWLAAGVQPDRPAHVKAPPFRPDPHWLAASSGGGLGGVA